MLTIDEIKHIKQELLIKFSEHLKKYFSDDIHECLLDIKNEWYKFEKEFYYFIGIQKVSLEVYEHIYKNKFIELAIGYVVSG